MYGDKLMNCSRLLVGFLMCMSCCRYVIADPTMTYCVYVATTTLDEVSYSFDYSNEYCVNMYANHNVVIDIKPDSKKGFYCKPAGTFHVITEVQGLCATTSSGISMNVTSSGISGGSSRLSWSKGAIGTQQGFYTERRSNDLLTCKVSPGMCHDGSGDYSFGVNPDDDYYVVLYPDSY